MADFFTFVREQAGQLTNQILTHIGLTLASLAMALAVGMPLGIFITRQRRLAAVVLGGAGVLQTVPSIALLGVLIPLLGIGAGPALAVLFLYALLPIIRNTYVGITGVNPAIREAAQAMGMTDWQVLTRVELPLAWPVLLAGIRTAAVINVGVATLAAYVAAGGLGEFIFGGIALNNTNMMLAGAIPAALLAVGFDQGLGWLQRHGQNRGGTVLGIVLAVSLLAFIPQTGQTRLQAGFAHEFIGRADGYPGLQKTYGLKLSVRLIDQSLMYEAIRSGAVDVISGYSTEGRIKAFNLRVLTDDRHAFPPYAAAPVVRQVVLTQYPTLQPTLNLLAGKLTDSVMTELNYRADYLHQSPEQIARAFLQQAGLYQPVSGPRTGQVVLGSKVFTEQYILSAMYKLLIEGHTSLRVVAKTGFGGTQLCFSALRTGAIDLYPEYSGTGLLVILQPSPPILDSLNALPSTTRPDAIFSYVQQQFSHRYGVAWLQPLGFNNAYCLMLRQVDARQLHIQTISDLTVAARH